MSRVMSMKATIASSQAKAAAATALGTLGHRDDSPAQPDTNWASFLRTMESSNPKNGKTFQLVLLQCQKRNMEVKQEEYQRLKEIKNKEPNDENLH